PIRSQDPKWVSVRNVLALSGNPTGPAGDAALAELADSVARRLPGKLATKYPKEAVAGRLRTVLDIANRPVAVADVHHDVEDVAEIFTRLNQQGTGVTEADVSLAVAATQHGGWVREEFLPFLRNLEESGYEVDPGVAIRVLTGGGEGHVRLGEVPREFWSSEGFGAAWENTRESLSAIVSGLVGSGVLSSALLPSQTALVPFALLHMKHGARGFLFPRALHWYLMACRDSRYSGSSSSTLSEDVRIVREATDFAEAIQALRGALEVEFRLTPDEFLARSTWSRPLLLIVYLTLASRKATDWATGLPLGQPRAEGAVEYGFAPHWHSLFPRSRAVLRSPRYDYTPDEVGAVANLVALNDRAKDRRWSSTPPSKYLETARVTDEQLTQQLVPLDHDLWDPDRYRDFLAARAAQLASACNDYLARLVGSAR
ncbi:MAG TPA: hypothetical protein VEY07_01375, partial [Thermoplasmata archaeon]|nr:hypothetical protein [Thermoplasmata archaeon]